MTSNFPSGRTNAAGKLQAGKSSSRLIFDNGLPCESNVCQTTAPPFSQPVPSAQATSISPPALTATVGCFWLRPIGETGSRNWLPVELSSENQIFPFVSHAATVCFGAAGPIHAELIGHMVACQ